MIKTLTDTELEYYAIIENRRNNPLQKGEYGEIHHIHPRSCGGSDCECNLVKLTPEEHYRCHYLLPGIFKEKGDLESYKKMLSAWWFMHHTRSGIEISEEEYGKIRKEFGKARGEAQKGKNNPMFGKHLSEETKQQISNSGKGKKHNISEEGMANIRAVLCGRVVKEETKKKLSAAHKGMHNSDESKRKNSEYSSAARWFHNESKSFFIFPSDPKIQELKLVPGRLTFKRKRKCQPQ